MIILESGDIIDVDLVPVFALKPAMIKCYDRIWNNIDTNNGLPSWLDGHPYGFQRSVGAALEKDFLIVPKPSAIKTEWRVDFHDVEMQIIRDKGCAKPIIKLLKVPSMTQTMHSGLVCPFPAHVPFHIFAWNLAIFSPWNLYIYAINLSTFA